MVASGAEASAAPQKWHRSECKRSSPGSPATQEHVIFAPCGASQATKIALAALVFAFSYRSIALAGGPAPTLQQRRIEINFMAGMIDHHEMAVEMADLCVAKAVHNELRTLCQNIKQTQQQQIGNAELAAELVWYQSRPRS